LAEVACDASSSHPSKLRTVISVPVASTSEEQAGIVQSVERGINDALAARMSSSEEAKSKRKKKNDKKSEDDDSIVIGVITDPAAVCIAHGLTEIEHPGVIDLDASNTESLVYWIQSKLIIVWKWHVNRQYEHWHVLLLLHWPWMVCMKVWPWLSLLVGRDLIC